MDDMVSAFFGNGHFFGSGANCSPDCGLKPVNRVIMTNDADYIGFFAETGINSFNNAPIPPECTMDTGLGYVNVMIMNL